MLSRHCKICSVDKNLSRCTGCKVVQYCSKEHQTANWPSHKPARSTVKKSRKILKKEEQALHKLPDDDFMTRGNPFNTRIGHFWSIHETRAYMRARFALVETILKINTFDAVEEAAEHLIDMCHLCQGDNMGVRDLIPALLLRLGKDQECCDFIKWWKTTGMKGDYEWGEAEEPYLDIKDADVLEPVEYICEEDFQLSHNVAATFLKIRLLLGVKKALRSTATLSERETLPPEVLNKIQDDLLCSTLGKRWDEMQFAQRCKLVDTLSSQIDQLYASVKKGTSDFGLAY